MLLKRNNLIQFVRLLCTLYVFFGLCIGGLYVCCLQAGAQEHNSA